MQALRDVRDCKDLEVGEMVSFNKFINLDVPQKFFYDDDEGDFIRRGSSHIFNTRRTIEAHGYNKSTVILTNGKEYPRHLLLKKGVDFE